MIEVYTDGSKCENGVGSGIAIFIDKHPTFQLKCKLLERCSNIHAEQLAIAKAEKMKDFILLAGKSTILSYRHRQQNITRCNRESQEPSKLSRMN